MQKPEIVELMACVTTNGSKRAADTSGE